MGQQRSASLQNDTVHINAGDNRAYQHNRMAVKSTWPVQTDHLSNSLRVKRRPRPCWVKKKGHQWSRLVKIKKLKQQQIIKLDKFKSQSVINTPFDSACWSSSVEIAPLLSLSTLWITKKIGKNTLQILSNSNPSAIFCFCSYLWKTFHKKFWSCWGGGWP